MINRKRQYKIDREVHDRQISELDSLIHTLRNVVDSIAVNIDDPTPRPGEAPIQNPDI